LRRSARNSVRAVGGARVPDPIPQPIVIRGATVNNFKGLDLEIPRGSLVSVIGRSGAGKSTLLKYVLLHEWEIRSGLKSGRSNCEQILGLPPVLFYEQKRATGFWDVLRESGIRPYLAYLGATVGRPYCVRCSSPVISRKVSEVSELKPPFTVAVRTTGREEYLGRGFSRAIAPTGEIIRLEEAEGEEFELAIDSVAKPGRRLLDAIDLARSINPDEFIIYTEDTRELFSLTPKCLQCGERYPPLSREMFSRERLPCQDCRGRGVCGTCLSTGLRAYVRLTAVLDWTVQDLLTSELSTISFPEGALQDLAAKALANIVRRQKTLESLEVGYLSLSRQFNTLSAGEAQRVRLGKVLADGIRGALIALDEPTSQLHQQNVRRLIGELKSVLAEGNSVICATHDTELIAASDWVIELDRGRVISAGCSYSIAQPQTRAAHRELRDEVFLSNITLRNLKGVDVILGGLSVVCGLSGSGKTTLVFGALLPLLRAAKRNRERSAELEFGRMDTSKRIGKIITFDGMKYRRPGFSVLQSLGLTRRLAELYAQLEHSKVRGLAPRDFMVGGEEKVRFRGYSFGELSMLTVAEAAGLFGRIPRIAGTLGRALHLGLGYLRLGQTEISLGEEKRIILARLLQSIREWDTNCILLLDEPTKNLHPAEQQMLIAVLREIADAGHLVVAIDHSQQLQAAADKVIELGPGAGKEGGYVLS
jgi:excinuclease ABC subunit A